MTAEKTYRGGTETPRGSWAESQQQRLTTDDTFDTDFEEWACAIKLKRIS